MAVAVAVAVVLVLFAYEMDVGVGVKGAAPCFAHFDVVPKAKVIYFTFFVVLHSLLWLQRARGGN